MMREFVLSMYTNLFSLCSQSNVNFSVLDVHFWPTTLRTAIETPDLLYEHKILFKGKYYSEKRSGAK